MMVDANLLPDGALQLVIGSTGDLLDRLGGFDAVTFTGSADTAAMLRANGNLIRASVPFTAEADSLNCAMLAPDVTPDDPEFDLFVKEVAREMTGKAGQKCTAIRRVIVPEAQVDAVGERLRERLAKIMVGDPKVEGVRMGALASMDQHRDVGERVELLARGNEVLFGARDGFKPVGEDVASGAFFSPTLLLCRNAMVNDAVHDVEAFGPVSTLMTYTDIDEALALAARGKGSLVTTLCHEGSGDGRVRGADRGRVARPRADPRSRGGRRLAPATARRCRNSSTAGRGAPVVAKNWAASAPCSTSCSAPRCRVRPRCWAPSRANTCAAARSRRATCIRSAGISRTWKSATRC